jgi:hypothetical protein
MKIGAALDWIKRFDRKAFVLTAIIAAGLASATIISWTIFLHITTEPCWLIKNQMLLKLGPEGGMSVIACRSTKLEEVNGPGRRHAYTYATTLEARLNRDECLSENHRLCGIGYHSPGGLTEEFRSKLFKEHNCLPDGTDACAYPDKKVSVSRGAVRIGYFRIRYAREGYGSWTLL